MKEKYLSEEKDQFVKDFVALANSNIVYQRGTGKISKFKRSLLEQQHFKIGTMYVYFEFYNYTKSEKIIIFRPQGHSNRIFYYNPTKQIKESNFKRFFNNLIKKEIKFIQPIYQAACKEFINTKLALKSLNKLIQQ